MAKVQQKSEKSHRFWRNIFRFGQSTPIARTSLKRGSIMKRKLGTVPLIYISFFSAFIMDNPRIVITFANE